MRVRLKCLLCLACILQQKGRKRNAHGEDIPRTQFVGDILKELYKRAGLRLDHVQHVRGVGARRAKRLGLSKQEIKELGQWSAGGVDSLEAYYLVMVPINEAITISGFTDNETYGLARGNVTQGLEELAQRACPSAYEALSQARRENHLRQMNGRPALMGWEVPLACLVEFLFPAMIQDMAWFVLSEGSEAMHAWPFTDRLFSSQLFTSFVEAMEPAFKASYHHGPAVTDPATQRVVQEMTAIFEEKLDALSQRVATLANHTVSSYEQEHGVQGQTAERQQWSDYGHSSGQGSEGHQDEKVGPWYDIRRTDLVHDGGARDLSDFAREFLEGNSCLSPVEELIHVRGLPSKRRERAKFERVARDKAVAIAARHFVNVSESGQSSIQAALTIHNKLRHAGIYGAVGDRAKGLQRWAEAGEGISRLEDFVRQAIRSHKRQS